jgi:hypothetical protein
MDTFTLRIDGGTQPRERLDEATVERYAEAMTAGLWDFGRSSDPAVAFYDGTEHWLSDGFHRLEAAKRAGKLDEFSACLDGARYRARRDPVLGRSPRVPRFFALGRRQAAGGVAVARRS